VFLSFWDNDLLLKSDKYVFYNIQYKTVSKVLCLLVISIASVVGGYCLNANKIINHKHDIRLNCQEKERFRKVLNILIYILIPGTLYKAWFDLNTVLQYGYMILFLDPPRAPLFARVSWGLFEIIFPLFLIVCHNKKDFKRYVTIFFIAGSISFLLGRRGELLYPLLFFVWFYYSNYTNKDISLKKLIIIIIGVSVFASLLLTMRSGTFIFDIDLLVKDLFVSQGVSYVFLANYLDYYEEFILQSRFYIISPITSNIFWFIDPVYKQGHSVELVQRNLSLDHQLMYAVSPEAYINGAGYGSNYIAELFSLAGILGVILGSFLLGKIIMLFENNYKTSNVLRYFSWFWIPGLFKMPRGNYLIIPLFFLIGIIVILSIKQVIKQKSIKANPTQK
jgi:hypothetical protein